MAVVETSGSIEIFCQRADGPISRGSAYSFDVIHVGDKVALCFAASDDSRAPYALKVRGPNGAVVIDRLLRALPTGLPQSEPAVELIVSGVGSYAIEIREYAGVAWGKATVEVKAGGSS